MNYAGITTLLLLTIIYTTSAVFADSTLVQSKPVLCEVQVSSDYWQANDKVKLEAYIDTPDCGAAYGAYSVNVRTKNEAGETHTNDYPEAWSRENAEPIKQVHSYDMNGDTDLLKLRVKMALGTSCVCGSKDTEAAK